MADLEYKNAFTTLHVYDNEIVKSEDIQNGATGGVRNIENAIKSLIGIKQKNANGASNTMPIYIGGEVTVINNDGKSVTFSVAPIVGITTDGKDDKVFCCVTDTVINEQGNPLQVDIPKDNTSTRYVYVRAAEVDFNEKQRAYRDFSINQLSYRETHTQIAKLPQFFINGDSNGNPAIAKIEVDSNGKVAIQQLGTQVKSLGKVTNILNNLCDDAGNINAGKVGMSQLNNTVTASALPLGGNLTLNGTSYQSSYAGSFFSAITSLVNSLNEKYLANGAYNFGSPITITSGSGNNKNEITLTADRDGATLKFEGGDKNGSFIFNASSLVGSNDIVTVKYLNDAVASGVAKVNKDITDHIKDTDNPHHVTYDQLDGLDEFIDSRIKKEFSYILYNQIVKDEKGNDNDEKTKLASTECLALYSTGLKISTSEVNDDKFTEVGRFELNHDSKMPELTLCDKYNTHRIKVTHDEIVSQSRTDNDWEDDGGYCQLDAAGNLIITNEPSERRPHPIITLDGDDVIYHLDGNKNASVGAGKKIGDLVAIGLQPKFDKNGTQADDYDAIVSSKVFDGNITISAADTGGGNATVRDLLFWNNSAVVIDGVHYGRSTGTDTGEENLAHKFNALAITEGTIWGFKDDSGKAIYTAETRLAQTKEE